MAPVRLERVDTLLWSRVRQRILRAVVVLCSCAVVTAHGVVACICRVALVRLVLVGASILLLVAARAPRVVATSILPVAVVLQPAVCAFQQDLRRAARAELSRSQQVRVVLPTVDRCHCRADPARLAPVAMSS